MSKRKDRERFEETGKVFRGGNLMNASKADAVSDVEKGRMRRIGHNAIQAMSTGNQIQVIRDSLHQGRLSPSKLRKTLEDNAHKEMRKGADKLRKKGKAVTSEG